MKSCSNCQAEVDLQIEACPQCGQKKPCGTLSTAEVQSLADVLKRPRIEAVGGQHLSGGAATAFLEDVLGGIPSGATADIEILGTGEQGYIDLNRDERLDAVRRLAEHGGKAVAELLIDCLGDPSETVINRIAGALKAIADRLPDVAAGDVTGTIPYQRPIEGFKLFETKIAMKKIFHPV